MIIHLVGTLCNKLTFPFNVTVWKCSVHAIRLEAVWTIWCGMDHFLFWQISKLQIWVRDHSEIITRVEILDFYQPNMEHPLDNSWHQRILKQCMTIYIYEQFSGNWAIFNLFILSYLFRICHCQNICNELLESLATIFFLI